MRKRSRRLVLTLLAFALVGAAALLPFAVGHRGPLTLNQTIVEHDLMHAGAFGFDDRVRTLRSRYSAGLDRLLGGADADASDVDLDDPTSVFRFVFENAPPYAIVYPTETYFYYTFRLRDRVISGNIRLLDAADGALHVGYFDTNSRSTMNYTRLDADDGVRIETIAPSRHRVTFEGRTVEFVLPTRYLERPASLELLEPEEFVSGVLDESGVAFSLLYNTVLEGFFYVVNPDIPLSETRIPVEGGDGRFYLGERTRFVYYDDPVHDRSVLVGVDASNVEANNYYDGPFDQVPPRLPIGDRLRAAYPYTNSRGGIDDHGNFIELDGQRVAISAYQTYHDLHALVAALRGIEDDSLVAATKWDRMTYEQKRDYQPTTDMASAEPGPDAPVWHRQAWPPNHWGHLSHAWPDDHTHGTSSGWPENHESSVSQAVASTTQAAGPPT